MVDLAPQQRALYEASLVLGELPASLGPEPAVAEALEHQAHAIQAAHRAGRSCVAGLLRSYGAAGPDLRVREPGYGASAMGMAAYRHPSAGRPNGSPEIASLLERVLRTQG